MKTVLTLILVSALTACGTVAGIGQDIKSSAEWTKDKMGGSK
jgi:predicted small secreted protein